MCRIVTDLIPPDDFTDTEGSHGITRLPDTLKEGWPGVILNELK